VTVGWLYESPIMFEKEVLLKIFYYVFKKEFKKRGGIGCFIKFNFISI
jgi:hypothetical protein